MSSVSLSDPRHRHIELQKDGNAKQLSCPSLIYSLSFKAEGQHVQTGGRSSCPKPEQQSDLLQWQRTESRDTYSLLRAKLPISHQVNLIGEVHTHGQLDEQIDAETIATLRDDGLTWTHKHSLISIIQLYIYMAHTHTENRWNRVWEDGVLAYLVWSRWAQYRSPSWSGLRWRYTPLYTSRRSSLASRKQMAPDESSRSEWTNSEHSETWTDPNDLGDARHRHRGINVIIAHPSKP